MQIQAPFQRAEEISKITQRAEGKIQRVKKTANLFRFLDLSEMEEERDKPTRDEHLAHFICRENTPTTQFDSNIRGLVYTADQCGPYWPVRGQSWLVVAESWAPSATPVPWSPAPAALTLASDSHLRCVPCNS